MAVFSKKYKEQFPLELMRVLAPWSAHARPSAWPPIDTSRNFPAHACTESPSNIEKPWKKTRNLQKSCKKAAKKLKKVETSWG